MIGLLGSNQITLLRQRTVALETQVESLASLLASTTERLAVVSDQLAVAIDRLEVQATELAHGEQRTQALTTMVADQAGEIASLNEQWEQRHELDQRVQADIIRIERQTMIDVRELRQTSLTLADRLLARYERSAGT